MNKLYELGQLCDIGSSKRIHLADYVEHGIPFYRSREIIELSSGKKISEKLFISQDQFDDIKNKYDVPQIDDILITSVGTIGVTYLVTDNNFYFKDGNLTWLKKIKKDVVGVKFLIKWLKSSFFLKQINNNNIGAVQKALTIDYLRKVQISLPNLVNQKKIAAVLSALDDKIELNNQINAELEAMAKTLYDYWFVQFDFPNDQGKPYKLSDGKMVYNEVLKREIPEGWEVKMLGDLTTVLTRGISPKYVDDEGTTVLNQKCIRDNRVMYQFARRHDSKTKSVSNKLIRKYDVLVNSTGVGTLGRVALVRWLNENEVTVDSHVTVVRPSKELINEIFFGYSVLTKQTEIESFANGSTGQVELNRGQLSDIKLIIPPQMLQNKFSDFYEQIIEKTSNNEKQNQELAQLRDWLLPMLMNGQVTVGDVEEMGMVAEEKADYQKS